MNMQKCVANFLSQYFTKYKLGWAEILQEGNYHYNSSPHQKLEKPTSRISRKMWIGCRWWRLVSWKPCIGLGWNLPRLFFLPWCFFPPNFMKKNLTVFNISLNNFLHFCQTPWGNKSMNLIEWYLENGKLVFYEILSGEALHQEEQLWYVSAQSNALFLRKWPSSPTTNLHFSLNPWCGFL